MAKQATKQIGSGVFGIKALAPDPVGDGKVQHMGVVLTDISVTPTNTRSDATNGYGSIIGTTISSAFSDMSFSGYFTNSEDIPRMGDIVLLGDAEGKINLTLPDLSIGAEGDLSWMQIEAPTVTSTGSDYTKVDITAKHYPMIDVTVGDYPPPTP